MTVAKNMRLSTRDLTQILDAVNILNLDQEPETLPRRTFDAVRCLIPTDVISYEAFGNDKFYQGPLWFEPTENVSTEMLSTMSEYVSDHPIFLGASIVEMRKAVRVSDFVTLPEFKQTVIYNEFFRPLGTDRQLSTALHVSPSLRISGSLCRLSKDYSARDCAVLDLLTPHLTLAFRNAQFTKRLQQEPRQLINMLVSANIALISLNADFTPQIESLNARLLLNKYYDSGSGAIPDEVIAFIKHNFSKLANDQYYLPPAPLEKFCKNGKLVIKVSFQSGTKTTILFIEEIVKNPTMNLSRLGVTSRESEVLLWISRGKTDSEIAQILSISVRTVQKHIENMFNKLGVETRTSAAAFILNQTDLNENFL